MIRILMLVCAMLLPATSWAETNVYGTTYPKYDAKRSDFREAGMLPEFNAKVDPEATLRGYPLGEIPKRTAFARHGQPHKIVKLANGKEGWVYEIPHQRQLKRYTLVFDNGVVIDVIYKDDGPGTGVTATEMQAHKARLMAEPPSFLWSPNGPIP